MKLISHNNNNESQNKEVSQTINIKSFKGVSPFEIFKIVYSMSEKYDIESFLVNKSPLIGLNVMIILKGEEENINQFRYELSKNTDIKLSLIH